MGLATEDLDVAELVQTIAATGRDLEESSKVMLAHFERNTNVSKDS